MLLTINRRVQNTDKGKRDDHFKNCNESIIRRYS